VQPPKDEPVKLLVFDELESRRENTARALAALGLTVAEASSSDAVLSAEDFPLVVLDQKALRDLKQCEGELKVLKGAQSEAAQLARIVASAQDAIISISLEGQVLSWNRGAEKLYGYTAAEMIGQPAQIIFSRRTG
jgi:PAS domain-containing protein